jgi:hypothetical protein
MRSRLQERIGRIRLRPGKLCRHGNEAFQALAILLDAGQIDLGQPPAREVAPRDPLR